MSTLSPWSEAQYSGKLTVAVATGDDLVAQGVIPVPTVMKIDVEGHEHQVLEGMKRILSSVTLRTVVFEDSPDDGTRTKALLREAGFRYESLARQESSGHRLVNFVARRRTGN
jgi:hypothetical protein